MVCDVWEFVARKKTSSIHQRGNLQKRKAKAKIYHEGHEESGRMSEGFSTIFKNFMFFMVNCLCFAFPEF